MFEELKKSAVENIKKVSDEKTLEDLRVRYLGRKGEMTQILRGLKDLAIEEKRKIGPLAQKLKNELEELFIAKIKELKTQSHKLRVGIDVSRPGKRISSGHEHILSKVDEEIRKIFLSLNFSVIESPELETEYYNFDVLNFPPDHPAREMHDTVWIKKEGNMDNSMSRYLMRTHTSNAQVRFMEKNKPPFQVLAPGRVFRYEATDMSHETNFHHVEGFMVGKDVSFANFKYIIEQFFRKFFSKDVEVRFRPHYFPFTEPSLEVDAKFKGKWLEMMGAGMIHRNVFKAAGYDPDEYQGFAFGMGLERLVMVKYNIPDIRLFYSGDLRFINQF